MDTDTQDFVARLNNSLTEAPAGRLWLQHPLLRLLAAGEPITVDRLATQTGRTTDQIRQALAAMPDTEYDVDGRIPGYGLTPNPTPHRYETEGRTLYAWCALDTLIFPALLGHTAKATSLCRATGEPVHLTVTPDGPTSVEPATAVVSLVIPDAPTSVRASFCNHVHFFADAAAAESWLAEHPDARTLPVADAYDAERPAIEQFLARNPQADCC